MSGTFARNLPDHTPAPETLAFAHELAALAATQTGDETMSDELAALAGMTEESELNAQEAHINLIMLYRDMTANPDDLSKRCAYFEALADGRLTDYYKLHDKFVQLENVAPVTSPTRRELLEEVTRLEAENATLRQQVDALTRERDAAVLQLKGLEQITDETFNAIWEIAGDGKGEWDYPAQITRYVGYLKDERDTARKWSALWKRMARGYRRMYLFLTTD